MVWAKSFATQIDFDINKAPQRISAMLQKPSLQRKVQRLLEIHKNKQTSKKKELIQVYADGEEQ